MELQAIKSGTVFKNTAYALLSLFFFSVLFYRYWDIPVDIWCYHHLAHTQMYFFALKISHWFSPQHFLGLALVVGVIGLFRRSIRRVCLFFSSSVILACLLANLLKIVLGRYRPAEFMVYEHYGFSGFNLKDLQHSMPSGHSAAIFAAVFALVRLVKSHLLRSIFILAAILVGISRLIVVMHYPSDVIFGAYLGILSAYWMNAFFARVA